MYRPDNSGRVRAFFVFKNQKTPGQARNLFFTAPGPSPGVFFNKNATPGRFSGRFFNLIATPGHFPGVFSNKECRLSGRFFLIRMRRPDNSGRVRACPGDTQPPKSSCSPKSPGFMVKILNKGTLTKAYVFFHIFVTTIQSVFFKMLSHKASILVD